MRTITLPDGRTFSSVAALCKATGTIPGTYFRRVRCGMTPAEAIGPRRISDPERSPRRCTDHHGNAYASKAAMCRAYGISAWVLDHRLGQGQSLQEALETPKKTDGILAPDGILYPTVIAMCDAYGISRYKYYSRIRAGWTMEDALLGITYKDHLGNVFPSLKKMCQAHHIDPCTYKRRRRRGDTVEQALRPAHTKISQIAVPVQDHMGRGYPSEVAMCYAYCVPHEAYRARMQQGWRMEHALETPVETPWGAQALEGEH